jgi:hypothetical protein
MTEQPAHVGGAPRRFRPLRLFLMVVCLGLVAMWVLIFYRSWTGGYAYGDEIPDRSWVAQAEAVCTAARPAIDALPTAQSFAGMSPADRAPSVAQATVLLEAMVTDLRALPTPPDARSQELTGFWLGSWDVYLEDRRLHHGFMAANQDARFTETQTDTGVPNTLRMDDFAEKNGMPTCQTLGDLA